VESEAEARPFDRTDICGSQNKMAIFHKMELLTYHQYRHDERSVLLRVTAQ